MTHSQGSKDSLPSAGAAAERLLLEAREEVARADSKASLLLAAVSLVLVVVAAVFWNDSAGPVEYPILLVAGLALLMLSMGMTLIAAYPRTGQRVRRYQEKIPYDIYFATLAHVEVDEYLEMADKLAERLIERNMIQAYYISRVVVEKYRWIRASMLTFFAGVLIAVVEITISVL
jgi:Family of unknown function (DUF5706)